MIEDPRYTWRATNGGVVALASVGDLLTAHGTPHTQGSKVELLATGEVTSPIEEVELHFTEGDTAGSAVETLVELFIDPAGGTAWQSWIPEIPCGKADSFDTGPGRCFRFRRHAPAGSSVAAAIRSSIASQTTYALIRAFGRPTVPIRRGTIVEAFGTITNSSGQAVTCGTSGTKGSWVDLGAVTHPLWWWELGVSWDDSTILSQIYAFDVAYGDGSNKVLILSDVLHLTNATRDCISTIRPPQQYCPVPAGAHIYVRGAASSGTADSNCTARVIGIGG